LLAKGLPASFVFCCTSSLCFFENTLPLCFVFFQLLLSTPFGFIRLASCRLSSCLRSKGNLFTLCLSASKQISVLVI